MLCPFKAGSGGSRFGFLTGDPGAGVCGTGEEPPLGDSSPFLRLVVVGWLVGYLLGWLLVIFMSSAGAGDCFNIQL